MVLDRTPIKLTPVQAAAMIERHYQQSRPGDREGYIDVLATGTQRHQDGSTTPFAEWESVECTVQALRAWLGY